MDLLVVGTTLINVFIAFFTCKLLYYFLFERASNKSNSTGGREVPGSMGWPIVGHLPFLDTGNPYPVLEYYRKKYGPIFRWKLGSWNAVVLTDYQHIKRAMSMSEFSDRPLIASLDVYSLGGHGILFSNGARWAEQRKFIMQQLNGQLGMGKTSMESSVQTEAVVFRDELRKMIGTSFDPMNLINMSIVNIIWAVVAGERMDYEEPVFTQLVEASTKIIKAFATYELYSFVPWLAKLLPESMIREKDRIKVRDEFHSYCRELIAKHKSTWDPTSEPRDFVDTFLNKQANSPPGSFYTDDQLLTTITDFYMAGGDTTATTFRWMLLILGLNPSVRNKMQEEIESVVGRDRIVTLKDQDLMPYTTAVVLESQRVGDISPMGLFRLATKDVNFEGYHIPANTILFSGTGLVHRDEKLWARPLEVYPEHFLTPDGKLRENVDKGLLPFQYGKRVCVGDKLARIILFIYLVTIYQNFDIQLADSPVPELKGDPSSGVAMRWPQLFNIIVKERADS